VCMAVLRAMSSRRDHDSSDSATWLSLLCSPPHPSLHSFPTRRSSDLVVELSVAAVEKIAAVRDELAGLGIDVERFGENSVAVKTDRKSTRLNSSHRTISYAVFCLKKKKKTVPQRRFSTMTALSTSRPP